MYIVYYTFRVLHAQSLFMLIYSPDQQRLFGVNCKACLVKRLVEPVDTLYPALHEFGIPKRRSPS